MQNPTQIFAWMTDSLVSFTNTLALSKSGVTVNAYWFDVAKFLEYLTERGVKRPNGLKCDHITCYLGSCKARGRSDASVNRYYMAIRSFCRHLRKTRVLDYDVTQDITPPKNVLKAPRVPSIDDIRLILEQPNIATESGMRDRAILELLYSSGLRASELCDLELCDLEDKQVLVRCGKRGKTRCVPLTESAYYWISEYVRLHRGNDEGYLFLTIMRKKVRRQLLCAIVGEYADKAGIKGVTTHTLRHACATHLLDQGADLRMIQEVLGHSSIASTQRYTHLSSGRIQSMFKEFHPRKEVYA